MIAVLQRLAWSLVILLGVTFLTFVIAFVIPSDPARTVAGPKADPQTLATIRKEMGLDQAVPVRIGFDDGHHRSGAHLFDAPNVPCQGAAIDFHPGHVSIRRGHRGKAAGEA